MPAHNSAKRVLCGIPRPIDVFDWHEEFANCNLLRMRLLNRDSNLQRDVDDKIHYSTTSDRVCFGFGDKPSAARLANGKVGRIIASPEAGGLHHRS